MKRSVLSYDEYLKDKKDAPVNEGFLDSILRFFKGLFDLFSNEKLKKKTEDSRKYWEDIEDDDEIEDDELADAVDTQRVRKDSSRTTEIIVNRIEVDTEKGIRTAPDLNKSLAGWLSQLIVFQTQILKMPILQKMLKDPAASKKFVWVPKEFREKGSAKKEWFADKNCVLDKNVAASLAKVFDSSGNPELVKEFSKKYVEFVAKQLGGEKKLKENRPEFLDNLFEGFSAMAMGATETMRSVVKNTSDDKISEVIGEELKRERKKKASKKPAEKKSVKKEVEEEDTAASVRARRSKKEKTANPKEETPSDDMKGRPAYVKKS